MLVLVACEFSGTVRDCFRERGHDAWSCDLLPDMSGSPYHYQLDALECIGRHHWDILIAHPPCTYLTVSGCRWWKGKEREQWLAIRFAEKLLDADIPRIALENPIGRLSTAIRKPDQIVQPWWFGHGEVKATCLWLKNLPLLKPTRIVEGRDPRVHWEAPGKINGLTRQQRRSITLRGFAEAMAEQWS